MTRTTIKVRAKRPPIMSYMELIEYIKLHYEHKEFISGVLTRRLRDDFPKVDKAYVSQYVNSALSWMLKKKLVSKTDSNPAKWKVLVQIEPKEVVEASEHGVYIVDIGDYETLLRSVEPNKPRIKSLVSSDTHTIRTKMLAAALNVPYRILPSSMLAENREGRWFIPPHI